MKIRLRWFKIFKGELLKLRPTYRGFVAQQLYKENPILFRFSPEQRVNKVHLVPLGNDQFYIHAGLNVKGMEIFCHAGDEKERSVQFRYRRGITAEIVCTPETPSEHNGRWFDQIVKDRYQCLIVPNKLISLAWDKYIDNRKRNSNG